MRKRHYVCQWGNIWNGQVYGIIERKVEHIAESVATGLQDVRCPLQMYVFQFKIKKTCHRGSNHGLKNINKKRVKDSPQRKVSNIEGRDV